MNQRYYRLTRTEEYKVQHPSRQSPGYTWGVRTLPAGVLLKAIDSWNERGRLYVRVKILTGGRLVGRLARIQMKRIWGLRERTDHIEAAAGDHKKLRATGWRSVRHPIRDFWICPACQVPAYTGISLEELHGGSA